MATDTSESGKPSYEELEAQIAALQRTQAVLINDQRSTLDQVAHLRNANRNLTRERDHWHHEAFRLAAQIEQTKHAPLVGIAVGGIATALLLKATN